MISLEKLREEIDEIDDKILELFIKRMEVCKNVGEFKKNNKVEVLQGNREADILKRIYDNSPAEIACGTELLFENIMDISKNLQNLKIDDFVFTPCEEFTPNSADIFACQGTFGAYSQAAFEKIAPENPIKFYKNFSDVFEAVNNNIATYGILPLENSTIGSVAETYSLMAKNDFYINTVATVEITHCLAAKKGTKFDEITKVFSKEEALLQCTNFLRENNLVCENYANTALSAEIVAISDESIACVCSEKCAEKYGLEILQKNIADNSSNFTRFICFSKKLTASDDTNIMSVCVSLPHEKGSLNRLLTRFSLNGLNLVKIESKIIAGSDFDVIFYLNFMGNYNNNAVRTFITHLENEMKYFRFLGNYSEI